MDACASLAGALLYIALPDVIPADAAMVICSAVVVAIRLLAAKYRWNLPTATGIPYDGAHGLSDCSACFWASSAPAA